MAVMDIHHPDILEFIECKSTEGDIHNFNISVGASDEFMEAVKNDSEYPLRSLSDPSDPTSTKIEVGKVVDKLKLLKPKAWEEFYSNNK